MKKPGFREVIELVGAVAVLVGLIFVGFELHQDTEAVQAATLQNVTDASQDYCYYWPPSRN